MLAHGSCLRQRGGDRVARGVVVAVALGDGPFHDRADPLAHAPHGLGLGVPVRDQDRHHVGGGDLVDPFAAEPLHGVVPERRPPLLLALAGVLPAFAVNADDGLDRLGEGGHVRLAFERDGIAAGSCDLPVLVGLLPGVRQGDVRECAEADVAARPVDRSPPDPVLRDGLELARFVDSESQSVLIAVDAGAVDASNECGGQATLVGGFDGGLRGNRTLAGHGYVSPIDSPTASENR